MSPDLIRFTSSAILVGCICTAILCAAFRVTDHVTYIALLFSAIFAGFVAATQPV